MQQFYKFRFFHGISSKIQAIFRLFEGNINKKYVANAEIN